MTDDDPFADLSETLEEDPDDQDDTDASQDTPTSTDETSADASLEEPDPIEESAFTYEDAQQRPFYARQESIEDFDSWLNYELERELSERGYQNIVIREMTDALLRTVVEEDLVDEVAERFEEAREQTTLGSNE